MIYLGVLPNGQYCFFTDCDSIDDVVLFFSNYL